MHLISGELELSAHVMSPNSSFVRRELSVFGSDNIDWKPPLSYEASFWDWAVRDAATGRRVKAHVFSRPNIFVGARHSDVGLEFSGREDDGFNKIDVEDLTDFVGLILGHLF